MATYTVKSGDTLSSIARKHNTTVSELMELNPVIQNKNVIRVGWVLTLPGAPDPVTPPAAAEKDYAAIGKQVNKVLIELNSLESFQLLMELM